MRDSKWIRIETKYSRAKSRLIKDFAKKDPAPRFMFWFRGRHMIVVDTTDAWTAMQIQKMWINVSPG